MIHTCWATSFRCAGWIVHRIYTLISSRASQSKGTVWLCCTAPWVCPPFALVLWLLWEIRKLLRGNLFVWTLIGPCDPDYQTILNFWSVLTSTLTFICRSEHVVDVISQDCAQQMCRASPAFNRVTRKTSDFRGAQNISRLELCFQLWNRLICTLHTTGYTDTGFRDSCFQVCALFLILDKVIAMYPEHTHSVKQVVLIPFFVCLCVNSFELSRGTYSDCQCMFWVGWWGWFSSSVLVYIFLFVQRFVLSGWYWSRSEPAVVTLLQGLMWRCMTHWQVKHQLSAHK